MKHPVLKVMVYSVPLAAGSVWIAIAMLSPEWVLRAMIILHTLQMVGKISKKEVIRLYKTLLKIDRS